MPSAQNTTRRLTKKALKVSRESIQNLRGIVSDDQEVVDFLNKVIDFLDVLRKDIVCFASTLETIAYNYAIITTAISNNLSISDVSEKVEVAQKSRDQQHWSMAQDIVIENFLISVC